jgi:hypothetical protein
MPKKIYTKSWLDNDTVAAWTFLTPALILLGVFIIWPIAYLFYLSFTAGSFTLKGTYWIGLKNYWRLLLNADFWQVLGPIKPLHSLAGHLAECLLFTFDYFTCGSRFGISLAVSNTRAS